MKFLRLCPVILLFYTMALGQVFAQDIAARCVDRAAIERVYHIHRQGTDQSFDQAVPRELIERLVRQDLHKEAVLRSVYGVTITEAQIQAETERIKASTRAPETLTEITNALGNDSTRFANAVVRPILVERFLRDLFANDDKLHAMQRQEAERARESALAAAGEGVEKQTAALSTDKAGTITEATWQLTVRPAEEKSSDPAPPPSPQVVAKSNAYTVEGAARITQTPGAPNNEQDLKVYFDDLDPELRNVLRAQLQKPGDVSAVIEMPNRFLIFLAQEKTDAILRVISFSLSKRSYEAWLAEQPEAPLP